MPYLEDEQHTSTHTLSGVVCACGRTVDCAVVGMEPPGTKQNVKLVTCMCTDCGGNREVSVAIQNRHIADVGSIPEQLHVQTGLEGFLGRGTRM